MAVAQFNNLGLLMRHAIADPAAVSISYDPQLRSKL